MESVSPRELVDRIVARKRRILDLLVEIEGGTLRRTCGES
jgi:hypothetical protein